ncbi:unnamed protein product, partial [Mesorhabditis spiculigera]
MPFWSFSREKDGVNRVDELLSEGYACLDQALIYDEDGDYDGFVRTDSIRKKLDTAGEEEAELVYFLPGGVQLFTIDVGPWVYPLMKDQTPVLKNEFGAYVVANPTPEQPNMMVAIMLPSDLDEKLVEEFEYVLKEYAALGAQEVKDALTKEEQQRLSERIANLLVKTGEQIAWGVHATTARVASEVEKKNVQYRSGRQPTENPLNISPAIKSSVVYMHKGGKVVAKCTRYLLDKIGDMGVSVGRSIASGARDRFGEGKTGGMVTGTITVLGGGITSVSTVWIALESASKNLCKSIANETVENVRVHPQEPPKSSRLVLAPENNDRGSKKKRHLTYKEGWVEFSRKSVAKRLAKSLNGVEVQVKAKHPASGTMWLCKYLPGFKWIHLMEQMDYERKVSMQRMKVEITQAKKVAEHFATQVEKGAHLRKLEEKVLKKGGLWEKHQRDIEQRKSRAGKKKPKTDRQAAKDEDDLMKLIYAD